MKHLYIICLFLLAGCVNTAVAQAPSIIWQNLHGGYGVDDAQDIIRTPDKGYLVTGSTTSNNLSGYKGLTDALVIKLDSTGYLPEWVKCYGGSSSEYAHEVLMDDGKYIIIGETHSTDGDVTNNRGGTDVWLLCLDASGNILWQKTYGGSGMETGQSIAKTPDGGYVFCGYTSSTDGDVSGNHGNTDTWVVKTNNTGTIQWQKCFGGTNSEVNSRIKVTSDSGYILLVNTYSDDGDISGNIGNGDIWLAKLDKSGSLTWQKCIGGSAMDYSYNIATTQDNGFIVASTSASNDTNISGNHGQLDNLIVKLDSSGHIQWKRCYGGGQDDGMQDILQTKDGTYICAGYTNSTDGDIISKHDTTDYWVMELDASGNILWQKCLGGNNRDVAKCLTQDETGNVVIGGMTLSRDGDLGTGINSGQGDAWIVKLGNPTAIAALQSSLWKIYPTHTNGNVYIEGGSAHAHVYVYNLLGQPISFSRQLSAGVIIINIGNNTPGQYYIRITENGRSQTQKLLLY
ncbi:MAG TPA: T9SS type A sorting domain-containing protein [Flavipsychrobacter sp.]